MGRLGDALMGKATTLALSLALAGAAYMVSPRFALAQQSSQPPGGPSNLDVNALFATTCGWCHSDGGRVAGKGPQLMGTSRSDDFIRFRIKSGKEGAMPAFRTSLSDADIDAIIYYIRTLKPSS
jgi:mono/diheme cytochrome c family protein